MEQKNFVAREVNKAPKKSWWKTLRLDMGYDGLMKNMAMDGYDWGVGIHVGNPTYQD